MNYTADNLTDDLGSLIDEKGDLLGMKDIFDLSKRYTPMAPAEIKKLLDGSAHELRICAVSVMDFQARGKKTTPERRRELFDLYINNHDKINTWDLVDRSAPYVVGGYLADKPRDVLYTLARSKKWWERRTAIVATYYFIRQNDLDDTFKIGEILAHDPEDLVQKAVGGWIREAGKRDQPRLLKYLDNYAATLPRTALRYAVEHLSADQKKHYMNLKKA